MRDTIEVRGGQTTVVDVLLQSEAIALEGIVVTAQPDPVGDTIVPAEVVFPLDFDQRHSALGLLQAHTLPGAPAALRDLQAGPEAIPYESPAYRPDADLDGNRLVEGPDELLPLYRRAARDFLQPLCAYGPPRLVRLGVQLEF